MFGNAYGKPTYLENALTRFDPWVEFILTGSGDKPKRLRTRTFNSRLTRLPDASVPHKPLRLFFFSIGKLIPTITLKPSEGMPNLID